MLHGLYVLVQAFWNALKGIVLLACGIIFGMLIYSIFAVLMIGKNPAFDGVFIQGEPVELRFGTITRSMLSLFGLMTLEAWDEVCRPLVMKQPWIIFYIGSFVA